MENPEPTPTVTIKEVLEEVEAKAREKQAAQNAETPLIAFINKFKLEKKRMQDVCMQSRFQVSCMSVPLGLLSSSSNNNTIGNISINTVKFMTLICQLGMIMMA